MALPNTLAAHSLASASETSGGGGVIAPPRRRPREPGLVYRRDIPRSITHSPTNAPGIAARSAADRLGARAALGFAGGAGPAPPAVSPTSCNAVVAAPAADAPAVPAPLGGPATRCLYFSRWAVKLPYWSNPVGE